MENFLSTDQDYVLFVLLAQTRDAIIKARQKELHEYNITIMQSAVLRIVEAIGNKATPAEIARHLFREPHSISELVSRMEKQGLVRKVKDLDRKDLVRVSVTKKGRESYHQSLKGMSIRKIMSSLTKEKRQLLRSCLLTLRDEALKELGMDRRMSFPFRNS